MKTQSLLFAIGAFAVAGTAYAQVPASNDTSTTDGNYNTGTGTGALGGPAATNSGLNNTASGFQALFSNTTGSYNTASGFQALYFNTIGGNNTASGYQALALNYTANDNTAYGFQALSGNTVGEQNTGSGYQALFKNKTGNDNTAYGYQALYSSDIGSYNTALGWGALYSNAGASNTASGVDVLFSNKSGSDNTASGVSALRSNTSGSFNTASGNFALFSNTTGDHNAAWGFQALYQNTTGDDNTASGVSALQNNTAGSSNIAVGFQAGLHLTTGSNNIDIGNKGLATDTGVIRIGIQVPTALQTKTFVAGIYNVPLTGLPVVVSSTGQLGVQAKSSERFKTGIAPMGSNSSKLRQLRPVIFHYKANPHDVLQYGLIAEEVAEVYPELVIRDEKGKIDGVRYDELAPMLLNEMQKRNATQDAEIRDLKQQQLYTQQQLTELKALNQATQAALQKLQTQDASVAQR